MLPLLSKHCTSTETIEHGKGLAKHILAAQSLSLIAVSGRES